MYKHVEDIEPYLTFVDISIWRCEHLLVSMLYVGFYGWDVKDSGIFIVCST